MGDRAPASPSPRPPPSCLTPPGMPDPAHGVWSEPALVALPGPEVGRPRAHRVGGAGAHDGGVHGRGLAGAVPARGTARYRSIASVEARKLPAAWTAPPPRGRGAGRGAAWPAAAPTFTDFTNIRRGASWGEGVDSGTRKGRPGRCTRGGRTSGRTLASLSAPRSARPSRGSLKANPKKGGRLQGCIPKKRGRCPRLARPETWELWGPKRGGGTFPVPKTRTRASPGFSRTPGGTGGSRTSGARP